MASPLYIEKLSLPENIDVDLRKCVAIDAGYNLTKVLCVVKEDEDSPNTVMTCATFYSDQSDVAIQWLLANSSLSENSRLSITGQLADGIKSRVKEITKYDSVVVDETIAHTKGVQFLVKNLDHDKIFFKADKSEKDDKPKFGKFMERIIKAREDAMKTVNVPNLDGDFPFIYADCGAKLSLLLIKNETDNGDIKAFSSICSLDLFGLGQLLLNTMDYNEVMELAQKGDRANVDCVAKEVFSISKDSPYATNPDLPLMHFGKPADHNFSDMSLENVNREDLANSLVHTLQGIIHGYLMASMRFIPRIYVGGNVYKHEYMRNSFFDAGEKFGMGQMPVKFLKFGLVGALGSAIVLKTSD